MYTVKADGQAFQFKTQEGVFYPTHTSELLIAGARRKIRDANRFLDLGCGIGVIGITLAKLGLVKAPIYASDLSPAAVELARQNARDHACEMVAKAGPLFEPWRGERFNAIVDDVPGITEEVASLSRWFPKSVPCQSGTDGIRLVSEVIEQAPDYLEPGGLFIFPVLSLSDTERLLAIARKRFTRLERILHRVWSLPEEMRPHMDFLKRLHREGKIRLEEKFGMVLWYTEVYAASN